MSTRRRPITSVTLAVVLAAIAAGGCSDDGDDSTGSNGEGTGDDTVVVQPAIDEIAPAIDALERELGAPQEYFEINATGPTVNLFVAGDAATSVTPYSYLGGELLPPEDSADATGATFVAEAVTFDAATILDPLVAELGDPLITRFVIVGGPDGSVQYAATVLSDEGGTLDVLLGPDGAIQSVDPG